MVRTFTPVIAGMSGMRYPTFLLYNAIGSAAWGTGLTVVGYFLGNIAFVGEHLDIIILIIAILSTLPAAATAAKVYLEKRRTVTENG
ncbi:transmembrane protein [Mycobacteroides abscessus subsp. massiliense]|nr:transmembrane protein [Mycobacteroides abscessus subsp. massiliense]